MLYSRTLGEGQPLIILHGLFGSSDNWISIGKALSVSYKVYLLDLRNHGQSFHDADFTYAAMANDVKAFMEHEGIAQPIMMGHSMGGKVVMTFALSYPGLVKGLVVVDIAPRYYPVHHQTILEGLSSLPLSNLSSRKEAEYFLSTYIPEIGVRQFLLKNLTRDDQGNFTWRINLNVIKNNIENVGEVLRKGTYDGPALFIGGGNSDYIQPSDKGDIEHAFPKATIRMIDGAGHWVHAEKPKELLLILEEFFSNT